MQKNSFMQKIFFDVEISFYAENFLLCKKIMQKVFCYAENFLLYRKIMQKVFLYAEKISFYAEKMSFKHEPFTKTMSIVN